MKKESDFNSEFIHKYTHTHSESRLLKVQRWRIKHTPFAKLNVKS